MRHVVPGVILGIAIGVLFGVGAYTFVYARGYSYLTDDAEACVNWHVMQDQFSGWVKSSHRAVAVCNDCHTPPGFFAKYATKARNGFWHSYYFTTGWFEDNIRGNAGEILGTRRQSQRRAGVQTTRIHWPRISAPAIAAGGCRPFIQLQ